MKNTIAMQDMVYSSNPEIILARSRNTENLITFHVVNIERYKSSQGAFMVAYTTTSNTNKTNNTYYVNYGLNGENTNIGLHPHLAPTNFNR